MNCCVLSVPLAAGQRLHVEVRKQAGNVARALLLYDKKKNGGTHASFNSYQSCILHWNETTSSHMNSPQSGERIQSSPSAGLSETEREKQSKTRHEGIDLLNQLNLKITHPIVATHSNAASSSGGQQAAFEAVATQHENHMSIHDTPHISL